MKVEIRKFKYVRQLLLIADSKDDQAIFDAFFGSATGTYNSKRINATLCSDDAFIPYIRVNIESHAEGPKRK